MIAFCKLLIENEPAGFKLGKDSEAGIPVLILDINYTVWAPLSELFCKNLLIRALLTIAAHSS